MLLQSFSRRRLAACTAVLLLASASAFAQTPAVRVSSKIDTEGSLLGSVMIQVLQAGGIKTENKLQLGSTKIVRAALVAGEIDLYPEYTGNGAFFFADEKNPAWKNAAAGYELVKQRDADINKLVWLSPAPANNTWSVALRKDVAQKNNLKSLADLGAWLAGGGKFKLAASAEFIERSDALPAFQTAYNFKLNNAQLLTLAGGDTTVTLKAAAQQTSGVLEDPKGIQPIYAPAPLIRAATLAQHPKIKDLLEPVFRTLDGPTLQSLNAKIAVEGQDPQKVAADYLKAKGFIK